MQRLISVQFSLILYLQCGMKQSCVIYREKRNIGDIYVYVYVYMSLCKYAATFIRRRGDGWR